MGNIPCFCDFPARSQIYSVKCQISHFWEIELNYLPDVMGSFKVSLDSLGILFVDQNAKTKPKQLIFSCGQFAPQSLMVWDITV